MGGGREEGGDAPEVMAEEGDDYFASHRGRVERGGEAEGKKRGQRAGGETRARCWGRGKGGGGGKLGGRDARVVSWSRFDRLRLG